MPSSSRRPRAAAYRRQLAADVVPAPVPDDELLGCARGGDVRAAGELYDRHGTALLNLAVTVSGSRVDAASAVVAALASACADAASTDPALPVLHELSRLTFQSCEVSNTSAPPTTLTARARDDVVPGAVGLDSLGPRQRALVALTVYGEHTYREAGALLGLSPRVAAQLLRLALLDAFHVVRTGLRSRAEPTEAGCETRLPSVPPSVPNPTHLRRRA
jgi:hypothetical protein